ncbi:response regulator [Treponema zioleckii]|uniref:response regulator n=1 Tax=Treponema zioleckii TaxID=331680 RepID=UPI00168B516A|nr:response regulator [Treponema zioleckii]
MPKILIVDDEKLIRAGIKKMLSNNYENSVVFLEAKNGIEALELCKTEFPDVMLTDIRMPGMDGVELMQNVSEMEKKPGIIVLSGFDDFSYAKAAIENGASSYILKPVDSQELIKAVNKALAGIRRDIQTTKTKKNSARL